MRSDIVLYTTIPSENKTVFCSALVLGQVSEKINLLKLPIAEGVLAQQPAVLRVAAIGTIDLAIPIRELMFGLPGGEKGAGERTTKFQRQKR